MSAASFERGTLSYEEAAGGSKAPMESLSNSPRVYWNTVGVFSDSKPIFRACRVGFGAQKGV